MASFMSKKRLAIIGSGNISHFHVPAMREAGFDIVSCCSRLKSKRAIEFSDKFNIPKVYDNFSDLIEKENEWDALLIAISVEPTYKVLEECMGIKKPILVEKPVSISSVQINTLKQNSSLVQVGYNRRFYNSVSYAKNFLKNNSDCYIKMYLPDEIDFSVSKQNQKYLSVKENSVHGLDILNYLVPNMQLVSVEEYKQPNNTYGKVAFLHSNIGHKCIIFFNWNAPSNFSLEINCLPYKLELKPFEKFSLFKGMEIINPTQDYPVRQYVPKIIESGNVFEMGTDFKPGFLEQSIEFMNLVNGKHSKISATLNDAYNTTRLAEQILEFSCP